MVDRGTRLRLPGQAAVQCQDWTLGEDKPTYTDSVHSSCFAADTPVLTLAGPMPIQMVKIGDQVLSQDPKTGALKYQPVIEALHNKPAMVLKIRLGNDTIKATGIHRFWKTGQGWIKCRTSSRAIACARSVDRPR